ncbi:MAG: phage gp6-like head-tail connector protein [Dehalobacter sp.]|nr:phage gp6-like head-tail connector protein [Dehalobacter sp.]
MTDTELLGKVKEGLGLSGDHINQTILPKVIAAKQYMLNAGVTAEQIETELGIATLTVGVNDLWNLTPGEVKFSSAFNILLTQLAVVSLRNE